MAEASVASKEVVVSRDDLKQMCQQCPRQPYLELEVPSDAEAVISVTFIAVSRDQGWADDVTHSNSWFEAAVQRPYGRSDIRAVRTHCNRVGNPQFNNATITWDTRDPACKAQQKGWVTALLSGDVIQLVPRAHYAGWVNIIQKATIKLCYKITDETDKNSEQEDFLKMNNDCYHRPLDNGKEKMIRLLVVEPGGKLDAICARFEMTALENSPQFDALSYVWGDIPDRSYLSLGNDGESEGSERMHTNFSISRSVEAAIRQLRSTDQPLRIWIDAICINQFDLVERSQQVRIMGDIYARAHTVHVWLGDEHTGIGAALRVIRDICNINKIIKSNGFRDREFYWDKSPPCPAGHPCQCFGTKHLLTFGDIQRHMREQGRPDQDKHEQERPGPGLMFMTEVFDLHQLRFSDFEREASGGIGNLHIWFLMQNFFCQPWFQRVWVVQEVLMSQMSLVHCAEDCITWSEVVEVNKGLGDSGFRNAFGVLGGPVTMPRIWLDLLSSRESAERAKSTPILDVFLHTFDMRATDPRDKLFAILPFGQETSSSRSIPQVLIPNYEKPTAVIMAGLTRWWIATYNSLAIFSFIHCQPHRTWRRLTCDNYKAAKAPATSYPTWAIGLDGYPELANKTVLTLLKNFGYSPKKMEADSRLSLLQFDDASEPTHIRLRGYAVGKITALEHPPGGGLSQSEPDRPSSLDHDINISTIYSYLLDPCDDFGYWSHPGERRPDNEDLYRTKTRAQVDRGNYVHLQAHNRYGARPLFTLIPAGSANQMYTRCQTSEIPACVDKCFFVTPDGRQGLCPWTAREGDLVTVLDGGPVPYLLRKMTSTETSGLDKYFELVGECFLEGLDLQDLSLHTELAGMKSEIFTLT